MPSALPVGAGNLEQVLSLRKSSFGFLFYEHVMSTLFDYDYVYENVHDYEPPEKTLVAALTSGSSRIHRRGENP